ncbi:MAG: hypothetical protein ABH804_00580 [archaeon]
MSKQYIPKTLKDSGIPPVRKLDDVLYVRYLDQKKIVRVARFNPSIGVVGVLYPTSNRNIFLTEDIFEVNNASPKKEIHPNEIKDMVWLELSTGKSPHKILQDYEQEMCGALPSGSYKFSSEKDSSTFIIIDREQ